MMLKIWLYTEDIIDVDLLIVQDKYDCLIRDENNKCYVFAKFMQYVYLYISTYKTVLDGIR